MRFRTFKDTISFTALALLALSSFTSPCHAQTSTTPGPVFVSIDDNTDILKASINAPNGPGGIAGGYLPETNPATIKGFDASATGVLQNELPGILGVGSLGGFDAHFEYLTSFAIAPGVVVVKNFNIFGALGGPEPNELSDTLGITFTGHQPGAGDNNNVSVDIHYRSDNETIGLTSLANGVSVNESNVFPGYIDLSSLVASGGPSDFNIRVASTDVPEPGSIALLAGLGITGGLFAVRRLHRRKK